jgi:hypothetical protein
MQIFKNTNMQHAWGKRVFDMEFRSEKTKTKYNVHYLHREGECYSSDVS